MGVGVCVVFFLGGHRIASTHIIGDGRLQVRIQQLQKEGPDQASLRFLLVCVGGGVGCVCVCVWGGINDNCRPLIL